MKEKLKISVLIIFSTVLVLNVFGQVPQSFNYQGVARDIDGAEISNKVIGVRLSIRNNSASGIVEYQEEHSLITNQFGLFSLAVGQGTPNLIDFDQIDWSIGQKWLQVELDTSGGTNYQDMGASQLLSTPYALYAGNAGVTATIWAEGVGDAISYMNGSVGIGTDSPNQMLSVNDTIQSLVGGFMFPDGTVQATAVNTVESFWRKNGTSTIEPTVSDNIRINADSIQAGLNSSVLMGVVKDNSTIIATGVLGSPITGLNNIDYQFDSNLRGPYVEFSNFHEQSLSGSSMGIMIGTLDAESSGGSSANVILNNVNTGFNAADFAIQCEYDGPNSTDYNEVARFTSEGNVGIGVSEPEQKLSVNDTIQSLVGGFMFPDGSVQVTAAGDENVWAYSGSDLYLQDSLEGRLVLGRSSIFDPNAIFQVQSDENQSNGNSGVLSKVAAFEHNIDFKYDSSTMGPHIKFANRAIPTLSQSSMSVEIVTLSNSNISEGAIALTNINRGFDAADLAIQTEHDEPGQGVFMREVARFTSEGNVGIGISEPEQKLSVAGMIESTVDGYKFPDGTVQITAAGDAGAWRYSGDDLFVKDSLEGKLVIGRSEVFDQNAIFQVQSIESVLNGNGGVGSRVAAFEHNIDFKYDPIKVGPHIKFANREIPSTSGASMSVELITLSDGFLSECAVELTNVNRGVNAADLAIQTEHDEPGQGVFMTEVARFTSEGNVGIGISEPEQKLSVAGMIESTVGGYKFPDGTVQATAFFESAADSLLSFDGTNLIIESQDGAVLVGSTSSNEAFTQFVVTSVDNEPFSGGSSGVRSKVAVFAHDVDWVYDPGAIGPRLKIRNEAVQSNEGSSMSLEISSASSSPRSACSVLLSSVSKGRNMSDLAIQTENDGASPDGVSFAEVARFTSEGTVGIGTGTPKEKLHVASGNVYIDDATKGVIMTSPNGNCWLMQVNDAGAPVFSNITCP